MKYIFNRIWLVGVLFLGCGEEGPTGPSIWEIPLADGIFSIDPGSHLSYRFTVDLSVMDNPAVVGTLTTTGEVAETVNVLVLSDANFDLWQASEPYVAVFESGQTAGGNIEQGIDATGIYHLVFSNKDDTDNIRAVGIIASVFYEVPAP